MRSLLLDYQNNRRKPGWPDIVLLAGGLAAAVYVGFNYVSTFSEVNTLETQQNALERKSVRGVVDPRLAALDAQQLRTEVKQANDVLAQLALPWESLFKDIESSSQNHVALLAIEPDSEKRVIKITGEAKNFDAMLGYIQFLQKKESLTGVYLQSHHVEERMAEKPVRFVLVASWVIKS
jgi:Tfp pilus assembly protein PilN